MKKLIILTGILTASIVLAQNDQPNEIDAKDLMDGVNKPEIDDSDIEVDLDEFSPKMKMPVLDPQADEGTKSKIKPVKKVKSKKVEKTSKKKTTPKNSKAKKPIKTVNATTILNIQQLKINDLIRVEFNQIKVYRKAKGKIVKYKFRNGIDLKSSGLVKKEDNTYSVKDTAILIRDTKSAKDKKKKQVKEKVAVTVENVENISVPASNSGMAALRVAAEKRLNNGKKIKEEIGLKNLRTNDVIYVVGDLLLVTRKNKATSGTKKFWLIESIDLANKSLEKQAKNRYKVLRKIKK